VMLKTLVKSLLPAKIKVIIGRRLIGRRERELGRLPLQQAFDEVRRCRGFSRCVGSVVCTAGSSRVGGAYNLRLFEEFKFVCDRRQ
jgi:hypothetical protein